MNNRILIVDDEANVRLNFRIALEMEGYEVFEARSAEQAFDILAEHSFALAILDMRLPGIDGLELLAKLRKRGNSVPAMARRRLWLPTPDRSVALVDRVDCKLCRGSSRRTWKGAREGLAWQADSDFWQASEARWYGSGGRC